MINILKLRKLQKENAKALNDAEAKTEKKDDKQSEDEIVLSMEADDISIPEKTEITELPETLEIAVEAELQNIVEITEDPEVTGTAEANEDIELSEVPEITEKAVVPEPDETNIETELDPAEVLRLQLLQDIMGDENFNAPGNPEEDQNAEREMLLNLMEENKKKREAAAVSDNTVEMVTENVTTNISAAQVAQTDSKLIAEKDKKEVLVQENMPDAAPAGKTQELNNSVSVDETPNLDETPALAVTQELPEIQNPAEKKEDAKNKTVLEKVVHLVEFQLGREFYGIDIIKIREIIKLAVITKVPRAPEFIEGVINLRGSVIPVICLRTKVKMPRKEYDKDSRIIILEMSGYIVGFIVDAVREVLRIPENLLTPPPELSAMRAEYIMSIAKMQDRLVILMDPEKVLTVEESKRLSKASA